MMGERELALWNACVPLFGVGAEVVIANARQPFDSLGHGLRIRILKVKAEEMSISVFRGCGQDDGDSGAREEKRREGATREEEENFGIDLTLIAFEEKLGLLEWGGRGGEIDA